MANVVETEFRLKGLDQYLRGVKDYNNAQTSLNNPKTRARATQTDSAAKEALQTETKYKKDSLKFEKEYSNQILREEKQRNAVRLRELKRTNQEAIREIERASRDRLRVESASRAGTVAGSIAGGLLAGGAFGVFALTQAVQATKEAEAANRALSASATEAGKTYAFAATEALQFGKDAAISNTQAARSIAELQRLLTLAGEGDQFQKYSKGFLDVASARGVQFQELSTLFQGLISGTDDALNRFGKADPSKLAEAYAKSIGKTVEQLTEREKVMSRLVAFESDFALFAGANADRLAGTGGQADQASKALADITTNLSLAVTQSLEFQGILNGVNDLLKGIAGYDPINIRVRLQNGDTPQALAEEVADSGLNRTLDVAKSIASIIPATFLAGYDLLTEGAETASKNLTASLTLDSLRTQRINSLTSQFTADKKTADSQKALAESPSARLEKEIKESKQRDEAAKAAQKAQLALIAERRKLEGEFRTFAADAISERTGNPLVSILASSNEAIQATFEKYKALGDVFAARAADLARRAENVKINRAFFDSALSELKFRQESFRLAETPSYLINGVPRREANLGSALDLAGQSQSLRNQNELIRLALRQNRPVNDDERIEQQFSNYTRDARRLDSIGALFGDDLGAIGREILAKAKLAILPSEDESAQLLSNQRFSGDARAALRIRARLNNEVASGADERLLRILDQESFANLRVQEAEEQAALLKRNRKLLTQQDYLDRFLTITSELGTENLTGNLRNARVEALNQRAVLEDQYRNNITASLASVERLLASMDNKLGGDLATVRIVNESDRASVTTRSNANNTNGRYN
jgi:hypothetical protein